MTHDSWLDVVIWFLNGRSNARFRDALSNHKLLTVNVMKVTFCSPPYHFQALGGEDTLLTTNG